MYAKTPNLIYKPQTKCKTPILDVIKATQTAYDLHMISLVLMIYMLLCLMLWGLGLMTCNHLCQNPKSTYKPQTKCKTPILDVIKVTQTADDLNMIRHKPVKSKKQLKL